MARAQAVVCTVIPGHERHLDTCICAVAEAGRYVSVHSDTLQSGYLPLGCGGVFFFFNAAVPEGVAEFMDINQSHCQTGLLLSGIAIEEVCMCV